ncbi:MAG: outer membrane protein assembly factor BamD [Bacteroidetes bacterium CG23_combo_of_CG06-09_8_20_14_all_32_9]|nr:MAG: outer membrane protein assembly factor BamD [Bacteroidetes bacterium CG23_combo_of_CG06-09_8_20_14_all_32_9]
MFSQKPYFIIFISLSVIFASCSKYQKYLKSSDYALKYEKGVEYYEKKDYYRAVGLFEELENIYKGSDKAEKIQFYMAYCYYNQGENILAAYYFKNFSNRYPLSPHSEECDYMSAYCSFLNSPDPSLDQEYTYKAIEEMQMFLNKYPKSNRVTECNKIIDDLRNKLEIKSFKSAKLYFDIGAYKAAIIALKDGINDFPDTQFREDIMYLTLKSSYLLAENSINSKKPMRYQDTVDEYYTLIAEFPQSKYLKEAEKIFNDATKNLIN